MGTRMGGEGRRTGGEGRRMDAARGVQPDALWRIDHNATGRSMLRKAAAAVTQKQIE